MGGPAAADSGLRKEGGHYYTKGSRHLGVQAWRGKGRRKGLQAHVKERGGLFIRTTALEGILLTY